MWPRSSQTVGRPQTSPTAEENSTEQMSRPPLLQIEDVRARIVQVLPQCNSTQITGPLYFGSPRVPSGRHIASHPPSFVSPQQQIQSTFQMPLETRMYEATRYQQRTHRGIQRQHPYRQNEYNCRISRWSEERSLQTQILSNNVEETGILRMSDKRKRNYSYICSQQCIHTVTMQSEETPIISSSQWPLHIHGHLPMWRLEESSLITADAFNVSENGTQPLIEIEDEGQNRVSLVSCIPRPTSQNVSNMPTDTNSLSSVILNSGTDYTSLPVSVSSNLATSISLADSINSDLVLTHNLSSPICDLQDLRIPGTTDTELSNHDRSEEDISVPPLSHDNGPKTSRIMSYRQWTLLMSPSVHAHQVANRIIKHARYNKTLNESSMWCPDCGHFPILPVTGQCGHTRCTKCIQNHGSCPCGGQPPTNLHVNTLIQDLIRKLLPKSSGTRLSVDGTDSIIEEKLHRGIICIPLSRSPSVNTRYMRWRSGVRHRHVRGSRRSMIISSATRSVTANISPRTPMSPQTRLEHARELLALGRYREAAPHLARAAASSESLARVARSLLVQTIAVLSEGRDPRRLTRDLYRSVRLQSASSWLKPTDLECVLCYHTYTRPVTTPCGHTYCRTCIERSMDYRKTCALCLRSLDNFDLSVTNETLFICAALASIDALNPQLPLDPDVIPIFVCTVAYPTIPCPLFIFDPRYWLMIRRVLESGSRKFGMVAYERDRTYSDYGTVLEVCDCVHLEDGRSILSTVGVSRFKVIERDVRDGCDVARIQPLIDVIPTEEFVIWDLRIMATQISYKALLWLKSMNRALRSEIEAAFGQLPHFDHREEDWWESADGPAWLWWLIAILPLRSEIKVLILSTKNLLKRMMAVSRTLEAIDQVSLTSTVSSECELQSALSNAEAWLERSA